MTIKSGISQAEVIQWGGAAMFNAALQLVQGGKVSDIRYDDEHLMVYGKVEDAGGVNVPVQFMLKADNRIFSYCGCKVGRLTHGPCVHVVAVGLMLSLLEMDSSSVTREDVAAVTPTKSKRYYEVPARPKFRAQLSVAGGSLSMLLLAEYSKEIHFPVCSQQPERRVYLEDPEDELIRRVRNLKSERAMAKLVQKYGFDSGYTQADPRMYLYDQSRQLNFLGSGLAYLRRHGIVCDMSDKLQHAYDRMRSLVPVVRVRDSKESGFFEVSCKFDTDGLDVAAADVHTAIQRGDSFILKNGKVTLFDAVAVEEMRSVFVDTVDKRGGILPGGWFRVPMMHSAFVHLSLDALSETIDVEDCHAKNYLTVSNTLNRVPKYNFRFFSMGHLEMILRLYQKYGVLWMRHMEDNGYAGLLADEMGLGKTLQTLTWLSLQNGGPSLIVCPTSLVQNWASEAAKFTPSRKVLVLSGGNRSKYFKHLDEYDLVVTSYALLQRDFADAFEGVEFESVVLDEAQHIKNRRTGNAKCAKALKCRHRLVLTGTPIENSVTDVWSIFDFLMPGYLGDYASFKEYYEDPIKEGGEEGRFAQEKLRRKLHPFVLRRLKSEVARDLPEKLVKVLDCELDDASQKEYDMVLKKERASAKTKFQMLALLMKLRRIASKGKVDAFMEQLSEAIEGGHRVLVFSQFVTQLGELRKVLDKEGIRYCYLDGSTKDRLGECEKFNVERDIPVFLISLMAGGTGLNLIGADMVIHYDPWWNPAVEDQATDRAHRIGQKKKVFVVKMIAAHTIEDRVLKLQRRKQALIRATINTTDEAIVNSLTLEELAELLA